MRLKVNQIERGNFKMIEYELYNYKASKGKLKEMRDDILLGGFEKSEIRSSGVSKPSENKALQLMSNKKIIEIERRIKAIELTYQYLDKVRKTLLEEKYFNKRTDIAVMQIIHVEHTAYYKYRRDIIISIADILGWTI